MTTDEKYMKQAIKQAKKAYAIDEVPIGCIIVRDEDGKVIARGYNRRNTDKNTLSHAELNAIRKARENGHLAFINTGRTRFSIDDFLEEREKKYGVKF